MIHPTQDPKYGIKDNRLVNMATGEPIPHDEPVFIFRAKDKHLVPTLAEYRMRCEDDNHAKAVEQREEEIRGWQQRNTDRLKEPDTASD